MKPIHVIYVVFCLVIIAMQFLIVDEIKQAGDNVIWRIHDSTMYLCAEIRREGWLEPNQIHLWPDRYGCSDIIITHHSK